MSLAILLPLSVLCKIAINLLLLKIIRVFDVISFSSCDTRVFQTALEGRWNLAPVGGNWKFYREDFFYWWGGFTDFFTGQPELRRSDILTIQTFFKVFCFTAFC